MEVQLEEQYADHETARYLFWADGGDFTAFEAGLDADPTVADQKTLTETETHRLYRVTLTEQAYETATFPIWSDLDLVLLEGKATQSGWTFQMRVPDREALAELRRMHQKCDRPFQLKSIFHESESQNEADALLTEAQREALVTAYESGYFGVPQNASQADIAAQLDISPQSLSERLQRGMQTLVESTLISG